MEARSSTSTRSSPRRSTASATSSRRPAARPPSVPPRFREVARTRDYVLYENTGRTGKRRTLDEGTAPGAVLDCKDPEQRPVAKGKGTALIWNVKPVIAEPSGWTPSDTATDGTPATMKLEIPEAGRG